MDQKTGVIVDVQQIQVSEVTNSYQMEKDGLDCAIKKVQSEGLTIAVLATDRHSQVAKYMKEENPQIDHPQIDAAYFTIRILWLILKEQNLFMFHLHRDGARKTSVVFVPFSYRNPT